MCCIVNETHESFPSTFARWRTVLQHPEFAIICFSCFFRYNE